MNKLVENANVKIYIVGGYVRDRLLGREGKDHDFVVVGATPEMMLDSGFKQVGADFPVFLHPETGDEYALARTERKTGKGYHAFETDFSTDVTLEDDLKRRDLTINSMAREVIGWNELGHAKLSDEIIDLFNGKKHLQKGIIKHTSKAFAEDPLRVLRAARFQARYGFSVAKSTLKLMKKIVDAGEMEHLTAERVWLETEKAIDEEEPMLYFWTLQEVGAYDILFKELGRTLIDTGYPLRKAALYNLTRDQKLALVFSGVSNEESAALLERLKAPSDIVRLTKKIRSLIDALSAGRHQTSAFTEWDMDERRMLDLLDTIDVYRREDDLFLVAPVILMFASKIRDRMDYVMRAYRETKNIGFGSLSEKQRSTLAGKDIGDAIDKEKLKRIKAIL